MEWLGSMGSQQDKRTRADWVSTESIRVRRASLGGVGQASPVPSRPTGSGRPTERHRRVGLAKVACGDAENSRRSGLAWSGGAARMNRAAWARQGRRGQPEAAQSTLSGTRRKCPEPHSGAGKSSVRECPGTGRGAGLEAGTERNHVHEQGGRTSTLWTDRERGQGEFRPSM